MRDAAELGHVVDEVGGGDGGGREVVDGDAGGEETLCVLGRRGGLRG